VRQRNPEERAALEALHDGHAEEYIEFKRQQGALEVHTEERDALAKVLGEWDAARTAYGLAGAAMITRDNATRANLNAGPARA
jgi:hypothetical protein